MKGGSSSGLYDAVCVKECPTGLAEPGSPGALLNPKLECLTNNDVSECPQAPIDTVAVGSLCLPDPGKAKEAMIKLYKAFGENENLTQYIVQVVDAKYPLLVMAGVVFVVTIAYIYLLRFIAKPVLYLSMFAIFVFGVLGGLYVWMMKDNYTKVEGIVNNYQYC